MAAGLIGCITTPAGGSPPPPGAYWCADNGCFGKGYPGDQAWWAWLQRAVARSGPELCAFAVAPDVVADAVATLARSAPWLPQIRSLGVPAALVGQDGLEDLDVPWDDFDVLFLGGTTAWKLSPAARELTRQARDLGKPVHCGRVNSARRLAYANRIGCETADGTFVAFGPDKNLRLLLSWLHPELDPDQLTLI